MNLLEKGTIVLNIKIVVKVILYDSQVLHKYCVFKI